MITTILESQYRLIQFLQGTANYQIYLGQNHQGHQVLVKLVFKPDMFFDELARYFALDHLDFIPTLEAHFPPPSMGGVQFADEAQLLDCISFHHNRCVSNKASHRRIPTDDVGILVTQWTQGESLSKTWHHLNDHEQLDIALKITRAVAQIHDTGEYHGQINPRHILISPYRGHLIFTSLGFQNNELHSLDVETSFSHFEELNQGQAEDVKQLANHFLIKTQGFATNKIVQACLDAKAQKRPSIHKVLQLLEKQTAEQRFLKPQKFMQVWYLPVLLIGFFALAHFFKPNRQVPMLATAGEKTAGLADLIRKTSPTSSALLMDEYDLRKPIAVLVFQQHVFLIGRNQTYTEGDEVYFRGQNYRIDRLTPKYAELRNRSSHHHLAFEVPSKFETPHASATGVFIWEHPKNLPRVLKGLAEIYPLLPPLPQSATCRILEQLANKAKNNVAIRDDSIWGCLDGASFGRFVQRLDAMMSIKENAGTWQVSLDSQQRKAI